MNVIWLKRYRMHFSLRNPLSPPNEIHAGYELLPWNHRLLLRHAEAKFQSFRHEIDANVFPCLADAEGCRRLMGEIWRRSGFIPDATWLAVFRQAGSRREINCGTVQGISLRKNEGSIQNLGVVPEHRGRGIARALLIAALNGFRERGLTTATLEVTACNESAIDLYQRFGFRIVRTVYKSIEVELPIEREPSRRALAH